MVDAARHAQDEPTLVIREVGVGSLRNRSLGWYGMMTLIVTEACLFGYLLFSYYYTALHEGVGWFFEIPSLRLAAPNTILLIASSFVVWFAERRVKAGGRWAPAAALLVAVLMCAVFMYVQWIEWVDKPFRYDTNSYGSLYFVVTGFHMAHVLAGLLVLLALAVWTGAGLFDGRRNAHVAIGAIYWHFVDVVWLFVFFTFYVTPYLGIGGGA